MTRRMMRERLKLAIDDESSQGSYIAKGFQRYFYENFRRKFESFN
jgi:hypothetical protein